MHEAKCNGKGSINQSIFYLYVCSHPGDARPYWKGKGVGRCACVLGGGGGLDPGGMCACVCVCGGGGNPRHGV